MRKRDIRRNNVAVLLSSILTLTGCPTTQLQPNYTSFDGCFRDQKVIAMGVSTIAGGVIGKVIGGDGGKGAVGGIVGAALGAVVGNRIAWHTCLQAFPVKSQTVVLIDRGAEVAKRTSSATQATTKSLAIQNISVSPMVFGKDLNVNVTYRYISESLTAHDVKAKVSRNLIFTGPDDKQHEVASATEDIVQQGVSRSTFAIPTPSIQDASELKSTKNWAFKFVVDVDGMHQEQVVNLNVPELSATITPTTQNQTVIPIASHDAKTISLPRGTTLFRGPNSSAIVVRLPEALTATVMRHTSDGTFNWMQVRLPDGKAGWIKDASR